MIPAMRVVGIAVLLTLAGCLSIPAEDTSFDASVFDADPSDAPPGQLDAGDGDAGINFCGDVAQFTGSVFPPTGMEVGLRDAYTVDLNNDGFNDIIFSNAEVSSPDDYGFFVLLGPQTDPQNLVYHAFIPTNVAPLALAFRDVLGAEGGCVDVTVWGPNKADTAGIVEVYQWDASPDLFDAATPVSRASLFRPYGLNPLGPAAVTYGDFSGAGHGNDLAVADLFEIRLLTVTSDFANSLPTATAVDIGSDGNPGMWTAINGIYARRSMRTGINADDLVVVENQSMSWMFNNGSGVFTTPAPVTASSAGMWNSKGVSVVNLDNTPPLDFIGSGGNSFGAYVISQNGETVDIATRPWNRIFNEPFNEIYGVGVANLGSTDAPELVTVDPGNGTMDRGNAYLVDTIFDTGTQLDPGTYDLFPFTSTGLNFRHVVIADFNGDQALEIHVFTESGEARCLRRKLAVGELEFCP